MHTNPIFLVIAKAISLYNWLVIVYIIMLWLLKIESITKKVDFLIKAVNFLSKIVEPVLEKIRKYIKPIGGVDLSALVLIIVLSLIESLILNLG